MALTAKLCVRPLVPVYGRRWGSARHACSAEHRVIVRRSLLVSSHPSVTLSFQDQSAQLTDMTLQRCPIVDSRADELVSGAGSAAQSVRAFSCETLGVHAPESYPPSPSLAPTAFHGIHASEAALVSNCTLGLRVRAYHAQRQAGTARPAWSLGRRLARHPGLVVAEGARRTCDRPNDRPACIPTYQGVLQLYPPVAPVVGPGSCELLYSSSQPETLSRHDASGYPLSSP